MEKRKWHRCNGFSLLEVMVVVFLLATFAAVGVFKLGIGQGAVLESEAKQFANKLNLLIDESILSGKTHRVVIDSSEGSYSYEEFISEKWISIHQKPYERHELPNNLAIELSVFNVSNESAENMITIQSDGVVTEFEFLLGKKGTSNKHLMVEDLHWSVSSNSSDASVLVAKVGNN